MEFVQWFVMKCFSKVPFYFYWNRKFFFMFCNKCISFHQVSSSFLFFLILNFYFYTSIHIVSLTSIFFHFNTKNTIQLKQKLLNWNGKDCDFKLSDFEFLLFVALKKWRSTKEKCGKNEEWELIKKIVQLNYFLRRNFIWVIFIMKMLWFWMLSFLLV